MYILFDNNSEFSIGCSDELKPFTYGVYIDNVNDFVKQENLLLYVDVKNDNGDQLYIDKNNIITTNSKNNNKLLNTITSNNAINFSQYPNKFSLDEVLNYKKKCLLRDSEYSFCNIFEYDMEQFINIDKSENFDIGKNDIKLRFKANVKTNKIDINKDSKNIKINLHSDNDVKIYYSFDGDAFKKTSTNIIKNNNSNTLFLLFKNNNDNDCIIFDYSILY